jgi:hypothetical protein
MCPRGGGVVVCFMGEGKEGLVGCRKGGGRCARRGEGRGEGNRMYQGGWYFNVSGIQSFSLVKAANRLECPKTWLPGNMLPC